MKRLSILRTLGCLWMVLFIVPATSAQDSDSLYQAMVAAYDAEEYGAILDMEPQLIASVDGKTSYEAGDVLSVLGETQYFDGDAALGLSYMVRAYTIFTELGRTDHDGFANLLFNLTYVHYEFGMFDEATDYGRQLLARDRADYGVNSEEFANSLVTVSDIYESQNAFAKGEALCLEALAAMDANTYPYFFVQVQLGDLYNQWGRYRDAEQRLLPSLALIQELQGSNTEEYAATLMNLASLYRKWGRFPESERFYYDARNILEAQPPTPQNQEYLATIQNNLANMLVDMARYSEALGLFDRLIERDKSTYGEDHPNYAISILNKSRALRRMGMYTEAGTLIGKALEVFGATLGEENLTYLAALNQQVALQVAQGEFGSAESSIDQVLEGMEALVGKESDLYTRGMMEKGTLYARQNRGRDAKRWLTEAQELGREVYSTQHPTYARITRQLAVLNWQEQDPREALKAYEETFANYFGQIDAYFPALSEPEKAKFYNNTLKVTFEEFNSFAIRHAEEMPQLLGKMYDYQLATKALIMYSTGKVREAILASENESLIAQFEEWLALKEQISKLYSMSQEELAEQPEPLAELVERANRLEKSLGEASQEFASTFSEERATWQQVRDVLEAGEAAVEIIRFREFTPDSAGQFTDSVLYAALVVRHDTEDHPELVLIENGKDLEADWVAYYRNSVLYHLIDEQSYANFWEPIKGKLEGIRKVYLSPDGLYHQVSFNTLFNPESGDFLLDEIDLEQVTNTKDLLAYQEVPKGPRTGKAFLFGFPNYNLGLDEETLAAAEVAEKVANTVSLDRGLRGSLQRYVNDNKLLAMLPGTKAEVEVIGQLYAAQNRTYTTFMADEAVEEQIKQMQPPSTLHIATHGFFLEDAPEAEAGAQGEGYVANPLLRSGLILAGANTFIAAGLNESPLTQEDGILTAYEVMNLNLNQTDLVVLSACETGLGTIKNGEGVYGLQRAFRVAGANAIIMSLWTVSDQATQQLMSLFYENWLATGNKQEAFLEAQKQLREEFPEPYYWGAFVMVGR